MRLSLVSCPIALTPATTEVERIKLNQLNPRTGNRISLQPVDSETGEKVERSAIVKGYKLDGDQYVILDNEELKNLKIESSSILDLEHFVDRASIDPIYVDTPYYIYPDKSGVEAYRVIAEAMLTEKKAAIGRIVMSGREHPVLVEPRGGGLMMFVLRAADEVRAAEYDFPEVKLDRKMIEIAATIMERQAGKFIPSEFRDRYQDALRELIEAKTKGGPPRKTKAPETGGNVVDLMEALRRSLAKDKTSAPANNARAGKKTGKADKRQASLLLPIKGSEKEKEKAPASSRSASPRTAARRKRA